MRYKESAMTMRQAQGIYLISMVAETLDMHPQTLRKYERAGLVQPLRMGTLRTYSDEDIARLRLIKHFVEGLGLNLAGVEMALSVTSELLELRRTLARVAGASPEVDSSLRHVDRMLARYGIRVLERSARRDAAHSRETSGYRLTVNAEESVHFSVPR